MQKPTDTTDKRQAGGPSAGTELALNYEDAFELTGHGYFNHLALVACSLIFMHSLIEMVATAYVLDPALCDLGMTLKEKGLVGSGIFFGIMITAICWGSISDHYGRRSVMLPALVLACVFSIASSMCSSFWPMFILRIFTGFLVSGSSATVLVYLGELNTNEHRDFAISVAVTSVAVIFVLVPVLAWAIIPRDFHLPLGFMEAKPWRLFMWTWSLIGLGGAAVLFILPESPRFILASKGPLKSLPILKKIYTMNHKGGTPFPVTTMRTASQIMHSGDTGLKGTLNDMLQLVKPPMLRCFILTHFAMFMVFLLCNGIYLWTPSIFDVMLKNTTRRWTVCDALRSTEAHSELPWFVPDNLDEQFAGGGMDCETNKVNEMMYGVAVIMEVVLLVPFLVITAIIEKYNKRLLYACVMCPCAVFLALSVLVPQVVVSSGVFLILGLCSGSCASILSALAVDAFPTSLRALAMCTMYMMGHVGAIMGNMFTAASATGPCVFLFLLQAGMAAGSAILILLFWPNLTKVRDEMESRGFAY